MKSLFVVALLPLLAFSAEVALENKALNPVRFAKPDTMEPLTLVKNGKPVFAIVADTAHERKLPKKAKSISDAVRQLAKFVGRQTGREPAVYDAAEKVSAGTPIVYVGRSAATDRFGIDVTALPPEGFVVKTVKGGVVLAGNDSSLNPDFEAKERRALGRGDRKPTVWAVYDFMERVFGMRFFYPGADGTLLPQISDIVLPPCHYTDAPRFKNRGTYYMLLKPADVAAATGVEVTQEDVDDFMLADRWAKTDSFTSMHSPFPDKWAKANPDKIETAFFRNPDGHLYFNANGHSGNYFDVTNLEFADALVESCRRFYGSGGKDKQGFDYNDGSYITFGQCDMDVKLEEMRGKPVVKELGLIADENIAGGPDGWFSDIYARFYKYLGERIKKEFPGKKLVVMPYSKYVMPPFQEKYNPPDNVEVGVCLSLAPRFFRNSKVNSYCRTVLGGWKKALGGRPVQQLWTYNSGNNSFVHAIATEEMGPFILGMGDDLGDVEVFHEFGLFPAPRGAKGKTCINFYYSTYAGMRAFWNPAFDFEAAIEEHWTPFYGAVAGRHLKEVHKILRESYFKYACTSKSYRKNPLYPVVVLDALEKELDAAEKATLADSVERRRFNVFAKCLRIELKSQRGRHLYTTPLINVPFYNSEWAKVKAVPLMNPDGSRDRLPVKPDFRLAWDEKGLYGRMVADGEISTDEKDMWRGNVVELFISPGSEKAVNHQICLTPLKQSFSMRREYKPFIRPGDNTWKCVGMTINSKLEVNRWTLDFFIPFSGLGCTAPKAGETWDFCFVYDKGSTSLASSCMNLGNNHDMERYGRIRFVDAEPLKVLMIGNSFSICNLREMPQIAKSMGKRLDLASLYIGGCSLERHWRNVAAAETNATIRPYRFDRTADGRKVVENGAANIPDALIMDKWDVVTIQQCSHFSWRPETYHPFGDSLVAKIRALAPQAKIVVQETWSYPPWDRRLKDFGFDQKEMYSRLHASYAAFAKQYGLEVIPVGTAAEIVPERNRLFTAPDFHFNGEGEYLQGLVFAAHLFCVDVAKCPYKPANMDAARAGELKSAAMSAVRGK